MQLQVELRQNTAALAEVAGLLRLSVRQRWTLAECAEHWGTDVPGAKALVRLHLNLDLGDRRTARLHVDDVAAVDRAMASRSQASPSAALEEARRFALSKKGRKYVA